jgi:hypothetical protein
LTDAYELEGIVEGIVEGMDEVEILKHQVYLFTFL